MKLIIMLLSIGMSIQIARAGEGTVIYKQTQKSDLNGIEFDLATLNKIEPTKFNYELLNKANIYNVQIGGGVNQFEKVTGTVVQEFSPMIGLSFDHYLSENQIVAIGSLLNKNSGIIQEKYQVGVSLNSNLNIFGAGRLGQKIAISKQSNSGFLFFDYGIGAKIKYSDYKLEFFTSKSLEKIKSNDLNIEIDFLKQMNKDRSIGFKFRKNDFTPLNQKYLNDKDSQQSIFITFGF